MDWLEILEKVFNLLIFPAIGVATIYVVYLVNVKTKDIKAKTDNETTHKYIDMLNSTITQCVIATNQTYVNSLKEQGKFDLEAQKVAFNKTYESILSILNDEAKEYLNEAFSDLTEYITSRIEFEVNLDNY